MVSSRLHPVLDETAQSIAGFAKRVKLIDAPTDLMSRRLDHALAGVTESAPVFFNQTALELRKELSAALATGRAQVDDAIKRIEHILVSRVADIELPTQEIDQRTRNILERFDESSEHLLLQGKPWRGECYEVKLKPLVAIQRVRLPPGKGAARQPEASLA